MLFDFATSGFHIARLGNFLPNICVIRGLYSIANIRYRTTSAWKGQEETHRLPHKFGCVVLNLYLIGMVDLLAP